MALENGQSSSSKWPDEPYEPPTSVTLITGGSSGIGLALAKRLLELDDQMALCMICKDEEKMEHAQEHLFRHFPEACIDIFLMDLANLRSVYEGAEEIKKRYSKIDYCYLNSGIMPVKQFHLSTVLYKISTFAWREVGEIFRTGLGVIEFEDNLTEDGLKNIFATNVFGHFVLLTEIQNLIFDQCEPGMVIWTSSSNATSSSFRLNDLQHFQGSEPYSSSKYAMNLLSIGLNEKWGDEGFYSFTVDPGLVLTNITLPLMSRWLWRVVRPVFTTLRFVVPSFNLSTYNGTESMLWLKNQEDPSNLDFKKTYHSLTSQFGSRYVEARDIPISDDTLPMKVFEKMSVMAEAYKSKYEEGKGKNGTKKAKDGKNIFKLKK